MTRRSARDDSERARLGQFAGQYLVDSVYTQLLGLCRGIVADASVNDAEVVALDQWLASYAHLVPEWPGQVLARRVKAILEDGVIEEQERSELLSFLERAAGVEGTERFDAPSSLPLTQPPPHVEYSGMTFCLTGTFIYGPRRVVEAAIVEQGGRMSKEPSAKTNFLVVGATVTPSWKYGTHGLKIEGAMEMIAAGYPLAIISEAHWSSSLC